MAVYAKADASQPIREGAVTYGPGRTKLYMPSTAKSYTDIDSLSHVVNLESRFTVAPSGWNEVH